MNNSPDFEKTLSAASSSTDPIGSDNAVSSSSSKRKDVGDFVIHEGSALEVFQLTMNTVLHYDIEVCKYLHKLFFLFIIVLHKLS